MANSFGNIFKMTSFGESHGPAMGVVIDGCPAGVNFDWDLLQANLRRRRPGQSAVTTDRKENDEVEVLSGVFAGKTTGTPIAMVVKNRDQQSADYEKIKDSPRPGHGDDVWKNKFGHSDYRGGGRSSGRETLSRVLAGSVAQMFLRQQLPTLNVIAFAKQIGHIVINKCDMSLIEQNQVRMPDLVAAQSAEELLLQAKELGKSYGGVVEAWVDGVPAGVGQPVFKKLKSELASAMLSIGATTGFELGEGFASASAEGSEFHSGDPSVYGGIRAGISTGEKICFRVAFKPTSSVLDVAKQGRHDPCIVPRAIPVIESMTYLVLADQLLLARSDRLTPL